MANFNLDNDVYSYDRDEAADAADREKEDNEDLDRISEQFEKLTELSKDPQNTVVMNTEGDMRAYSSYGGRYDADDTAFYARAIGRPDIANRIAQPDNEDLNFFEKKFAEIGEAVATRLGHSREKSYAIDPTAGYIGEITEDYEGTDLIGNVLGLMAPKGAKVDRFSARELTGTGIGRAQFGNYSIGFTGVTSGYRMSPQEEQKMFADQRNRPPPNEGDADRVVTKVTGNVPPPQVRSGLLPTFLGYNSTALNIAGPDLLPPLYDTTFDFFGFEDGGVVGEQQQSDENVSGPVGFVGDVPEAVSEAGTVADDVPMEVEEGTYILNAAAVEFAGSKDIKAMLLDAIQEAVRQGVDMEPNVDKIKLDKQVSLLVSKGEVVIPPKIAQIIGYDRLEKINNRGKQETEKRVQENGQSPEAEALDQQAPNPANDMAMAKGGDTSANNKIDLSDIQDYKKFKNPQASWLNRFETFGAGVTLSLEDMEKAVSYSQQYREKNNTDDSYEDTMRHTLLGGLYNPVAGTYADLKEGFHKYLEGYGKIGYEKAKELVTGKTANPEQIDIARSIIKESEIDLNNNIYGRELRRQIPDETNYVRAVESLMDIARKEGIDAVPSITTEDGETLKLQLSIATQQQKMAPGGVATKKRDRYLRPDQRPGMIDYSLSQLDLKKKFQEMHDNPPPIKEAEEFNDTTGLQWKYGSPNVYTGDMLIKFDKFLRETLDPSNQTSQMLYQELMDTAMEEASAQALDQYYYSKGVEDDGTPTDMSDRDVTEQKRVKKQVKEAKELYLTPSFLTS